MSAPPVSPFLGLTAGPYSAFVSRAGATLCSLTREGVDLVLPVDPAVGPVMSQGEVLVPWPNRVDGGRYFFGGVEHQLEVTEPGRGNAIHGLARHREWTVRARDERSVGLGCRLAGAPGYPWDLDLEVTYTLDADAGLRVAVTAVNLGAEPAPYGNGTHSFLTVGGAVDDTTLHLPAATHLAVDDRMIPTGDAPPVANTELDFRAPRRVGSTVLDTAFTTVTERDDEGRAWVTLSGEDRAVALWADATYGWIQAFSAERPGHPLHRRGLAVEPMTCPPNAFASGTDVITLGAGETTTSTHGIRAVAPLRGRD
ncbi:aldose 1-epimerase family protein [Spiractinospora alimapuensis]|uniref:aldose 1-epimerase family protein n=1 Tax=Spiractinospora alimapuensis TaxID=2820884 RepID=UPI001F29CA34|nr:aldose 1-epimerase family protein [Spiractinospora alimapuensis]QVQ53169.1 aldose 1-epimerase family protein [Spiractinospora alimapuensis]